MRAPVQLDRSVVVNADTMTPPQQEAKLRLVGEVAHRVWPNG
jgi:hypothetical protein